MAQKRNRLHRDTMEALREEHSGFLQTVIPFSVEIERMGLRRKPVLAYASQRSPARAYDDLCAEILALK